MKVRLRRVGGFAGLNVEREVDSAELSERDARRLLDLVEKAPWSVLPNQIGLGKTVADLCQYTLTVGSGRSRRSLCGDDLSMGAEARDLVEFVAKNGRPRKPKKR